MTEKQRGYIAAMIDGEGSISIREQQIKSGYCWQLKVEVANDNYAMLLLLKAWTKLGKVEIANNRGQKTGYRWRLNTDEIKAFLPIILDYLIIKKEQALLMIEFFEGFTDLRNFSEHLKEQEIIRRMTITREIQELNS